MNEVSLKPVIEELENLFSKFNARFFADKLEKPVITVSPDHTRGAYPAIHPSDLEVHQYSGIDTVYP